MVDVNRYVEDPTPQRPEEVPEFLTRELPRISAFSQEVQESLGGLSGTVIMNFGSTPTDTGTVVVTGVSKMLVSTPVHVFVNEDSTGDHPVVDHQWAAISFRFSVGTKVAGTGFTITAYSLFGDVTGQFKLSWLLG